MPNFVDMKKIILLVKLFAIALIDAAMLLRINPGAFNTQLKGSVKFSALMVGIKGKVGGTVFQGSKVGFTIKNKPSGNFVKPIKWLFGRAITQSVWDNDMSQLLELSNGLVAPDGSNTNASGNFSAQQLIKQISKEWSNLDASDRAAWAAAAINFPFTNKWGEQYTGSGYQVFMSINNKLMALGQALQTLPPSPSDGSLPAHTWNTIYLNNESSGTDFLQLRIPDGIAAGAAVVVRFSPIMSAGKLKTVFGGKGQVAITTEEPSTVELLPLFGILFGRTLVSGAVNIEVDVINLSNGHSIYTANFQQIITEIPNAEKAGLAEAGVYDPAPGLSLIKYLNWTNGNITIPFGDIAVDHDSEMLGYLLRIVQLLPGEAITITKASATPDEFFVKLGSSILSHLTPLVVYADNNGVYGNPPLICQFSHAQLGAKSCTITISAPSLSAPLVVTLTGTGI